MHTIDSFHFSAADGLKLHALAAGHQFAARFFLEYPLFPLTVGRFGGGAVSFRLKLRIQFPLFSWLRGTGPAV